MLTFATEKLSSDQAPFELMIGGCSFPFYARSFDFHGMDSGDSESLIFGDWPGPVFPPGRGGGRSQHRPGPRLVVWQGCQCYVGATARPGAQVSTRASFQVYARRSPPARLVTIIITIGRRRTQRTMIIESVGISASATA